MTTFVSSDICQNGFFPGHLTVLCEVLTSHSPDEKKRTDFVTNEGFSSFVLANKKLANGVVYSAEGKYISAHDRCQHLREKIEFLVPSFTCKKN